jgi:hypothetical protein
MIASLDLINIINFSLAFSFINKLIKSKIPIFEIQKQIYINTMVSTYFKHDRILSIPTHVILK